MPLQKAVHFLRQLLAYPFGRCNFFHARRAQALDRTEAAQEQILPVLAHPGAVIEDALADPFFHQQLMISVGKAVRFIPDALEQTKRARILRQAQRQRPARSAAV